MRLTLCMLNNFNYYIHLRQNVIKQEDKCHFIYHDMKFSSETQ